MNIHLIAIGGSVMHNLAIALHKNGNQITGSDDEIFEPSKSRLKKYNILPKRSGWFPEKITKNIDYIILGMHAKKDNPELLKAKKLNLPIYSFPEYIYKESINKKRIVIGGSHGKTSITAMILHVLKKLEVECDYLVGAQLEGFETMVKISKNSSLIVLEGDEYLSSAIDKRPKFHLYKPHIGVISGIAWDHINVFPTFDIYIEQFKTFKELVKETLIYFKEDKKLINIINQKNNCKTIGYNTPSHKIINGKTIINGFKLNFFGEHNLQNLNAALLVCQELGISKKLFFESISSFKGASKRLELIKENKHTSIYKDFAHSPSKLKATIKSVKQQFPNRKLVSCMELHTFSSLNKKFLKEYSNSMDDTDIGIVYFNKKTIKNKKLNLISKKEVIDSFKRKDLKVFNDSNLLKDFLNSLSWKQKNLLMMSSGNFNNLDLNKIISI
ncbi:MAG: peptidoglycan synthetase [Flavobacteriales bacterium]|nr:peptidoglycan synthetase [Flavobacteriales bacterium]